MTSETLSIQEFNDQEKDGFNNHSDLVVPFGRTPISVVSSFVPLLSLVDLGRNGLRSPDT